MPTSRPRHFVTETDEVAAALDAGSKRRPGLSRSQVLARLALEGHRAALGAQDRRRQRRLAALHRHSGCFTGVYESGHLEQLHEDWPA